MPTRSRGGTVAAATVVFVVFAGWVVFGWGGPVPTMIAGSVGAIAFSAFAVGCAVTAIVTNRGRRRIAWLCLAPGLTGWLIGDVVWAYFAATTHARPPYPSLVDLAYFLLPLCAYLAALLSFGPRVGLRLLLDGVIVAASLFVVAWSLGLREVYEARRIGYVEFAITFAYPFADLAMIAMVAVFLLRSPPGQRQAAILLLAGVVFIGLADTIFVHFSGYPPETGKVVALGWSLGLLLVGASALTSGQGTPAESGVGPRRASSNMTLWLPYLPVPAAIAVAVVDTPIAPGARPILITGLVLVVAALIRQLTLLDENRKLQDTVADIALRDPLTSLPNRALFADRLQHAMQLRLRHGTAVAVLVADLDDFKLVNDSYGHPVGDELLRHVGDRVQHSVREGDTVARLGGDEFAILIEDTPECAAGIAESVARSFDEPFVVAGRELTLRLSIGLASATPDTDVSAAELFKRAELAMYSAKRAHATGATVFTPEMGLDAVELRLPSQQGKTGGNDGISRIRLLADLHRAIDERELTLVYQPKFSLATGAAVGVEALIRWPHPEHGTLQPADFLPLVRENGLMEAVTDLVIHRAIEDAAGWYRQGIGLPVGINLSAPSLDDITLPDRILGVLADHGMPTASFTVEITEDVLLTSFARTRTVLDRLRQKGIRVALDDFGSGYAAMTYLHELPIDELKLDRHFVAPILHDERAAMIVRSVIELAAAFGLSSVAEGVENQATADRLKEYGCGYVQGFYLSPPVPADAIRRDWLPLTTAATGPSSA